MDAQFWIKAWNEGRTNFHQGDYNEKLTEYFPRLNPQKGQKVLVPLCGKTKDLLWLCGLDLRVHGIELYEQPVKAFFTENKLPAPEIVQDSDFTHYSRQNITISCGDFLKLTENQTCDFVYDRAALVALPFPLRERYVQVIKQSLKKGGKCLLIVYEYDASKMEGPPFSVDENEIRALYGDQFTIQQLESTKPNQEGSRLAAAESLRQNVYLLHKSH